MCYEDFFLNTRNYGIMWLRKDGVFLWNVEELTFLIRTVYTENFILDLVEFKKHCSFNLFKILGTEKPYVCVTL